MKPIHFKLIPKTDLFKELIKKATTFKDIKELDPECVKRDLEAKKQLGKKKPSAASQNPII